MYYDMDLKSEDEMNEIDVISVVEYVAGIMVLCFILISR